MAQLKEQKFNNWQLKGVYIDTFCGCWGWKVCHFHCSERYRVAPRHGYVSIFGGAKLENRQMARGLAEQQAVSQNPCLLI